MTLSAHRECVFVAWKGSKHDLYKIKNCGLLLQQRVSVDEIQILVFTRHLEDKY